MQSSESPFPFLRAVERLKHTPRRGWAVRGIGSPESVSDHMYRMAVMIMMTPGVRRTLQSIEFPLKQHVSWMMLLERTP